ncbi:MAG: tetratricopeptide repeat protein [Burkholderiaceae bacterium]|jgi:hypothetical protein
MSILAQQLMSQDSTGFSFSPVEVARFSPEDIRLAIQSLLGEDRVNLAYALGDAGLALYPESEDILAVTSLLAVMAQDWPQAVDLIRQLMEMQNGQATVFTHAVLIRSLRCNLEYAAGFEAARDALALFPNHPELVKEYQALADAMGLSAV